MTATRPSRATRQLVVARSGAHCEVAFMCGADGAYLPNVGGDIHHRYPAKSGGSRLGWVHAASNLLAACRSCHSHIESARIWAYDLGLSLKTGFPPRTTPVYTRHGFVVLDDAGSWTYATEAVS